jgi:hypothetical protein
MLSDRTDDQENRPPRGANYFIFDLKISYLLLLLVCLIQILISFRLFSFKLITNFACEKKDVYFNV